MCRYTWQPEERTKLAGERGAHQQKGTIEVVMSAGQNTRTITENAWQTSHSVCVCVCVCVCVSAEHFWVPAMDDADNQPKAIFHHHHWPWQLRCQYVHPESPKWKSQWVLFSSSSSVYTTNIIFFFFFWWFCCITAVVCGASGPKISLSIFVQNKGWWDGGCWVGQGGFGMGEGVGVGGRGWWNQMRGVSLDLKLSSDSASVISSGRAFHSGMVRGKNDICLYWVLLLGMS